MKLHLTNEPSKKDKQFIEEALYSFNLDHLPQDLRGRYEEISLFLKDEQGVVHGGILGEICWNWLEIEYLILDADVRKEGYGSQLLMEIEKIAIAKKCDFIKVDTLSFQALDFYKKHGYHVFGSIDNVGREFEHYYLKKNLVTSTKQS
ncbi:GNAT family N-acetyltransferase [Shouchella patagoniensis]|uniref:GNAT family N-acetyltransferase n=1 Tax=Shouchella patagoniensis TaxID=228576 RepID=UPI0009952B0E|nr:GNAT family N-acetyltransferase [Shouchella patagoniensis]